MVSIFHCFIFGFGSRSILKILNSPRLITVAFFSTIEHNVDSATMDFDNAATLKPLRAPTFLFKWESCLWYCTLFHLDLLLFPLNNSRIDFVDIPSV